MLATLIIVLREVLEAGLVVGIVLAVTRGVPGRGRWVMAGLLGGLLGAAVVAMFAGAIADSMAGFGQEAFNAAVLFLAVLMLGWHNVWMSRHGRQISARMNAVGREVAKGARPLTALALVVGLAVLREGSEVVLFLYGIAAAGVTGSLPMLSGGLVGIALGALVSAALYFGLLRIPMRYLFTAMSWLITLLAAGMAAQGAGYLVAAEVLPALVPTLWDTSHLLSDSSLVGQVLHTLVGYIDRPAGIQVLFYGLTVTSILVLTRALGEGGPRRLAVESGRQ